MSHKKPIHLKRFVTLFFTLLLFTNHISAQDITNGLVGYYTFCDCSATDHSGNHQDGVIIGTPQCISGVLDYGLLFNQNPGSNGCGQLGGQYITLPKSSAMWSAGFTVCAWARYDDIKSFERIIDFSNGTGESGGMPIWFGREGNTNNLAFESWINNDGTQARATGRLEAVNAITNGNIEFYCATISANSMCIYVNGQLVAQRQGNPIANVSRTNNFIGHSAWCNADPDFKGFMDEVRIYNRALSNVEISQLYKISKIKDFAMRLDCNSTIANFSIDSASTTRVDSVKWNFDDVTNGMRNTGNGYSVTHDFSTTGIFNVKAIVYNTCINDTVVKQISINKHENFLGSDFNICRGVNILKPSFVGSAYLWQDGSTADSFIVVKKGIYWLQETLNGCTYKDSVTINSNQRFYTYDTTVCEGANYNGHQFGGIFMDTLVAANGCDSIIKLNLTITPKSLSTINQTICQGQTFLGHSVSGIYVDTLLAFNGCDSIRTLLLTVLKESKPYLGPDLEICLGESIVLSLGTFANYLWQNGSTQPTLAITQAGHYFVTVTDACGSRSDSILVIPRSQCGVYFPNAFSPNADGKNDEFKILNGYNVSTYHLSIYSRLGQKVFETTDPLKGWNGTFNSQPFGTATFVWTCELTKSGSTIEQKLSGVLTLIR